MHRSIILQSRKEKKYRYKRKKWKNIKTTVIKGQYEEEQEMESNGLEIRIATEADAKALLEIYAYYVEHTAITFEYEVPTVEEFTERIREILKKYPYIVAVSEGKIVGYAYAGVFKNRAAFDWAVETTVYVHKDKKGLGIGKILYLKLEEILAKQNILNMEACIAYTETEDEYLTNASVRFHEKLGYRLVGEFRQCGYKFNRWYHMVWMEKHIGEHTEVQVKVKTFKEIVAE